MIINLIIGVILELFVALFYFLPIVTIADIPGIGSAISTNLIWAVGIWNAFLVTFPYAQTAWSIFLTIILPFELLLLIGKVFLGSRNPAHSTN